MKKILYSLHYRPVRKKKKKKIDLIAWYLKIYLKKKKTICYETHFRVNSQSQKVAGPKVLPTQLRLIIFVEYFFIFENKIYKCFKYIPF